MWNKAGPMHLWTNKCINPQLAHNPPATQQELPLCKHGHHICSVLSRVAQASVTHLQNPKLNLPGVDPRDKAELAKLLKDRPSPSDSNSAKNMAILKTSSSVKQSKADLLRWMLTPWKELSNAVSPSQLLSVGPLMSYNVPMAHSKACSDSCWFFAAV